MSINKTLDNHRGIILDNLISNVEKWGDEKGIIFRENFENQFKKFQEEIFEFRQEMLTLDFWIYQLRIAKETRKEEVYEVLEKTNKNVKMEFGDVMVTMIIMAKQLDIDLAECLEMAYEKIKDRKGKTINGTFVKEADL